MIGSDEQHHHDDQGRTASTERYPAQEVYLTLKAYFEGKLSQDKARSRLRKIARELISEQVSDEDIDRWIRAGAAAVMEGSLR